MNVYASGPQTRERVEMSSILLRTCRNVVVDGCRTSLRLERLYWDALDEVCRREGISLSKLVTRIKQQAQGAPGVATQSLCVTSAVRVFAMTYFRSAATEEGHVRAGHNVGDPVSGTVDIPEPVAGASERLGVRKTALPAATSP